MPPYQVVLSQRAKKDLKNLDNKQKARVITALLSLEKNPYLGKRLAGRYQGCFSLKLWPYRIIYKIYKNKLIVLVIRIG